MDYMSHADNKFLLYGVDVVVSSTLLVGIVYSFSNHLIGLRFPHIETLILGAHESVPLMSTGKLSWQV